jgi:hypothetical protein
MASIATRNGGTMKNRRRAWLLVLAIALLEAQVGRTAPPPQALPELLYTCPMHADVLEDAAGTCPICKMKLEPVRIETDFWYACPIHAATLSKGPGLCPLDKRQKMPVVVTVHWACSQSPNQKLMEPGQCADGTARREIHQIRAHGDHNPRHGGQFYMASDNWHHVEGTYPRGGLFRVFFYDNFTQPIDVSGFTARLLDAKQQPIVLKPGAQKNTLEAALGSDALPVKVALEVAFDKSQKANHFDFQFTTVSKEPQAPPRATPRPSTAAAIAGPEIRDRQPAAAAKAAPVSTAAEAVPTLTSCAANVNRSDVLLLSEALPKDRAALLKLLGMCQTEVQTLIDTGRFGFVYQPTMLGKDIALALEANSTTLPERRRLQATEGTRRMVLSAWELDLYGDLGNQQKLTEAYERFAAAVGDINAAYATQP